MARAGTVGTAGAAGAAGIADIAAVTACDSALDDPRHPQNPPHPPLPPASPVVVLWTLDRARYLQMETRHPSLCLLLQHALLKSLAIAQTASLFALHPSSAYSVFE